MDLKNPFSSKRIRRVPEPDAPSPFQTNGGWGDAADAAHADLDPGDSEREQRLEGARALAALYAQQDADKRAARDAALAGVRVGRAYPGGQRI